MAAISWRTAALLLGEKLGSAGPDNYYMLTPENWYKWALEQLKKERTDVRS